MKKLFLIICAALLVAGCGGEHSNNSTDDAKTFDKIIIGLDDEFAPMGFRNEQGALIGFDIDLAREVAKRMDVDVEFKPIDWDKKREAITSGNVDMIWNGLDITDERKEYMIFTKPYMDDRQILLVKKDNDQNIHAEGDLENKRVGVQAGSIAENYLDNNADLKITFKEYKTYGKFQDALDALGNGTIDVFLCDELVARYEMNLHPDQFQIIDVKTGYVTEMGIGFRKEDTALRDRVQLAFDEMVADGTAKRISEQWFQADLIKVH